MKEEPRGLAGQQEREGRNYTKEEEQTT